MTLDEFLSFRKNPNNYKNKNDYLEDNKIRAVAYYGKNNVLYIKKLNHTLTKHQLSLDLYMCENGIVWGK